MKAPVAGMNSLALTEHEFVTEHFDQTEQGFFRISNPDTNTWYVKPFWRKNLEPARRDHAVWRVWSI